jgi:hypothetical protein
VGESTLTNLGNNPPSTFDLAGELPMNVKERLKRQKLK